MARMYGSKYNKFLHPKDASRGVRKDIDDAMVKGELPFKGFKAQVRTHKWQSTQEIDITVLECPFPVLNRERFKAELSGQKPTGEFYNPKARALLKKLREMLEAYNFHGDSKDDVLFHAGVAFAAELVGSEKQAIVKESAPEPDLELDDEESDEDALNELEAFLESKPPPARKVSKSAPKPMKAQRVPPIADPPRRRARSEGMGHFLSQPSIPAPPKTPQFEAPNLDLDVEEEEPAPAKPKPEYWY